MHDKDTIIDYTGIFVWIGIIAIGFLVYLIYKRFKKK
jgi:LPXTG-motif cell wall-anchored protein